MMVAPETTAKYFFHIFFHSFLIMDDDPLSPSTPTATDDDLGLPKATVTKLISEMLPDHILCDRDARDLLVDCCTEFVHVVATEANDLLEKQNQRKTLGGEQVLEALKSLGFGTYVEDVKREMDVFKVTMKEQTTQRKKKQNKLAQSGLSEEELIRQQEDLFRAAREKYEANLQQKSGTAAAAEEDQ
jgi:histone H3/H4